MTLAWPRFTFAPRFLVRARAAPRPAVSIRRRRRAAMGTVRREPIGTLELGIGADADVGFAWSGRRWCRRRSSAASYRVIANRSENLQHRQWGALPRSLSAAAAAARKDQRNLAAFTALAALTRAREWPGRFQRALTPTDLHRPARRRCGWWPTSTVLFSGICCWQIRRRTLELGIGADADVGFAWSGRRWCRRRSSAASYRVIANRSENLQHRQWGALPRSLSAAAAAARKDQRNLAAFTALAALRARAKGRPIPTSSDADRPAPAGSAALRLVADVDSSF